MAVVRPQLDQSLHRNDVQAPVLVLRELRGDALELRYRDHLRDLRLDRGRRRRRRFEQGLREPGEGHEREQGERQG